MLRPLLKLLSTSLGSLSKSNGDTRDTVVVNAGSSHRPWTRTSTDPIVKDGGPFVHLPETPPEQGRGEAWEMWEGRGNLDIKRTNLVERSNPDDLLGQAELGALPKGAIYVRQDIDQRDSKALH